jgi:hypothetical protein
MWCFGFTIGSHGYPEAMGWCFEDLQRGTQHRWRWRVTYLAFALPVKMKSEREAMLM